MVLRHVYRELTEDSSAASSLKQADLDIRVAQFLLSADDTDLVLGALTNEPINGIPDQVQKHHGRCMLDSTFSSAHLAQVQHVQTLRVCNCDAMISRWIPFGIC